MTRISILGNTGYQKPFRRDRNKRGGGTAIYCADHLPVRRRNDLEDANSECIWIECLLNNYKLLLAVYYRSPGQLAAARDIFLSSLTSLIELAQDIKKILNQPTRIAYDGSPPNVLDLVITDSPNKFMECKVIPLLVKIDHCNTICEMYCVKL